MLHIGVAGAIFLGLAFFISLVLTPLVIRMSRKRNWVDAPSGRKIHKEPIPRLGGVAIFTSLWASWLLFGYFYPSVIPLEAVTPLKALFWGSSLIFALGVYDDIFGANAFKKLIIQTIAASIVVYWGFHIKIIYNPFQGGDWVIGRTMWGAVFSVVWIVVVTNAINLIDGLDGLAGGVSLITALTIFFISRDLGIPHLPYFFLCLAGAIMGFLIFNFNPARIFLGDSGSLFLGFILACTSIMGTVKRSTAVVMLGPPLVLAIPMLDTIFAIVRRFLKTAAEHGDLRGYRSFLTPRIFFARLREIFQADQSHIHHALVKIGLSHRKAVLILYILTAILGVTAYRVAVYDYVVSSIVFIGILGGVFFVLSRNVKDGKLQVRKTRKKR